MKIRLKIFVAVCVILSAAGCGGSDKGGETDIPYYGSWVLTRWQDAELPGMIYLQLKKDGSFNLYQSLQTFGFKQFTGSYLLSEDGTRLSGSYTGGTPWESSYVIEKHTKEELWLRSETDGNVSVYTETDIPDYVKDNVTDKDTRAAAEAPFL